MPNIKAAEKWVRQSEKRTVANKDRKTRLKTIFKKALTERDDAFSKTVESELDKAAKTGVVNRLMASRKKSRLSLRLNAAKPA